MFKPGDKVKCIVSDKSANLFYGNIYTIKCKTDDDEYYLEEDLPLGSFYKNRFRLVKNKSNSVESPSHYVSSKFEVIDIIEAYELGFNLGNVTKYTLRAGKKDPTKHIEDLKKALWYLQREISTLEKKDD